MYSNTPQFNQIEQKPSFWVANPHLKALLLVLMVALILSGLGIVALAQWQANYREKIYEQTEAGLPRHKAGSLTTSTKISDSNVPAGFKEYSGHTVYGDKYQFSVQYPDSWTLSEARGAAALVKGQCTIVLGAGGKGFEGDNPPEVVKTQKVSAGSLSGEMQLLDWGNSWDAITTFGDGYLFEQYSPKGDQDCLGDYLNILQTVKINL